jgi:ribosomal protein S10
MIIISLKSNNLKSIIIFLIILYNLLNKLYIIKKIINKPNLLTVFALLKSPHINKTAQQHFGFKFYHKTIFIKFISTYNLILWIKLFREQLFHDISLMLSYNIIKKIDFITTINFTLSMVFLYYSINIKKQILKIFDILNLICIIILSIKLIAQ